MTKQWINCTQCGGTGMDKNHDTCKACHGSGGVEIDMDEE
jgi:DnaJ-class molecular chaperone